MNTNQPTSLLLTIDDVLRMTGYRSRSSIYRLMKRSQSVLYTDDRTKMQVGLQERAGMAARALKERGTDMQDGKQKAREKAQDASLAL